jgi:hypothetical protein
MAIDARRALDVWVRLVRDEELYDATMAGRHRDLAAARRLDADDLVILDEFRERPGTRWNVENIRFRAALQVSVRLRMWMPLTVFALTRNDEDWLNDLAFEYLVHHRWSDLGPYQLTECERFGAFVRQRVVQRRRFNRQLEPILAFELAVIELLNATEEIPADAWTGSSGGDDRPPLGAIRPRRGPAVRLIELPLDVTPWLQAADPTGLVLPDREVHYLVYVPSLQHAHRVQTLSEGARVLFERCTGERTSDELASQLADEFDMDPAGVRGQIQRWLDLGALAAGPRNAAPNHRSATP